MMVVEQQCEHLSLSAPAVLTALLNEFSAVTDYRTLRDSLPRRLAHLLNCRCVLLYQRLGETLQFAAGTFDDVPGWSASLLSVAHINPIDLSSDLPEARAWRSRHPIACPPHRPDHPPGGDSGPAGSLPLALVAVPLIYRQRAIGILVAFRNIDVQNTVPSPQLITPGTPASRFPTGPAYWTEDDLPLLEAVGGVVALLLENARLLERDRERIHELSLLNSIASQLNCSMYEPERVHNIILQRTREITSPDHCALIWPDSLAETSWNTPALQDLLLTHFSKQREPHPLIIERPGDSLTIEYLNHLPPNIKTFFAVPLLVSEGTLHRYGYAVGKLGGPLKGYPREILLQRAVGDKRLHGASLHEVVDLHGPKVLGIIVGVYHRAWKLRREELVLLQVLASQASAVLENMHLVTEVVEARNEARKLLRQVLDDQRLKELILESVPSGLITIDLSGCITTFNRAAQAILGYHPFEVLGQPLQKILNLSIPAGSVPGREGQPVPLTSDDVSTVSETLVTMDRHAQEVVLDVHLVPLYNDQREQIGWLATFVDVTSMHRLEEEKRRLDRLASLGEMAASVAHEVRNPLASIKTSVQMLMDDLGDFPLLARKQDEQSFEAAQESVTVVLKEVERLDAIVRELLFFARPRQLHCIACNMVELSEHVLNIMQPQCTEMGVIIHRVYHDIPVVQVDMAQMEQVLFNLYMNAIQAMPEGGVLTVSCQVIPCVEGPLFWGTGNNALQGMAANTSMNTPCEQGKALGFGEPIGAIDECSKRWLELSVSDTGIGIAPDQLERIFQPFYTTKAHGIGLGLPITRRLVEDHRGHLLVESQPGFGTTISVRLPIT